MSPGPAKPLADMPCRMLFGGGRHRLCGETSGRAHAFIVVLHGRICSPTLFGFGALIRVLSSGLKRTIRTRTPECAPQVPLDLFCWLCLPAQEKAGRKLPQMFSASSAARCSHEPQPRTAPRWRSPTHTKHHGTRTSQLNWISSIYLDDGFTRSFGNIYCRSRARSISTPNPTRSNASCAKIHGQHTTSEDPVSHKNPKTPELPISSASSIRKIFDSCLKKYTFTVFFSQ